MEISPSARKRRKEIRDEAKRILIGRALYHPYFPHDIYINVTGIKEWLNQPHLHYEAKNEILLELPDLIEHAIYLGSIEDPKGRDFILTGHVFKVQIDDAPSWVIVNENIWGEYWVHSVSDNYPYLDDKQDL